MSASSDLEYQCSTGASHTDDGTGALRVEHQLPESKVLDLNFGGPVPIWDEAKVSEWENQEGQILSESGSITPTTLGSEYLLSTDINSVIQFCEQLSIERQEQLKEERSKFEEDKRSFLLQIQRYPDVALSPLKNDSTYGLALLETEEIDLEEISKLFTKISKLLQHFNPNKAIMKALKKLAEDERYFRLVEDYSGFALPDLSTPPLCLRTYQQEHNGFLSEKNPHTVVSRFVLLAENLSTCINAPLEENELHPLEQLIFQAAIAKLKESAAPSGVACDTFVRKNGVIHNDQGHPETHCVVLWKVGDTVYLIDPNRHSLSKELYQPIEVILKATDGPNNHGNVEVDTQGVVYKRLQNQAIGRGDNDARDCVDLAIKLILELVYQCSRTEETVMEAAVKQIASLGSRNAGELQGKNYKNMQTPRNFATSDADTRHNARLLYIQNLHTN
ncbi:MAG: hypothetical protein COA94_08420 [Rickettsiales bacterium]|nr:MAG: hypothetical protein COA94_08420 [Rickettsiales bacterium]